jgi:hypothetical protein
VLQKCSANVNALYSKVYQAQLKVAHQFEQQHFHTPKDFDFQLGSLVLMHNTQTEKSLNKKMHARYIGPLIVVSCKYCSAYILSELDGTVLHHPITTFHLLPHFPCKSMPLLPDIIDIDDTCLQEIEHSLDADRDEEDTYHNLTDNLINKALLSLSIYFSSLILSSSSI